MGMTKLAKRQRIRMRVRKKVRGTAQRPRLSVFRSNRSIYVQAIDDVNGLTLASASSHEEGISGENKTDQAREVGKRIGQRLLDANIETVKFDRGSYLYHGRVKALAEGAREVGVKF